MRVVVHRLAYIVTFIVAVLATLAIEQMAAEWAVAQGYDNLLKALVYYMINAGFDTTIIGVFLFLLGVSGAFLADDLMRRRDRKGTSDARVIFSWSNVREPEITPTYNIHWCFWRKISNTPSFYIGVIPDKTVKKPHIASTTTAAGTKVRELCASDRFMFLELECSALSGEILICLVAEDVRAETARRQEPNVWHLSFYMEKIPHKFAYGEDHTIAYRLKSRVSAAVYRLRQLLRGTES